MKKNTITLVFLVLAVLTGFYVGGSLLFFPAQLQAESGISLSSASQFSEARAPGAAIFAASMIALLSLFKVSLRKSALGLMTLFFTAYGLGRLLSVVLDGVPADGLYYAMYGELIMGVLAGVLYLNTNRSDESLQLNNAV